MLVLVAHGSRDPLWRNSIHDLARTVEARFPEERVGVAFMQFDGPTLQETLEEGRAEGHTSFKLLPLFMASAGHVDKDIKPLVEELARAYPELEMSLLTPVGEDGRFPSLVIDIYTGTLGTR